MLQVAFNLGKAFPCQHHEAASCIAFTALCSVAFTLYPWQNFASLLCIEHFCLVQPDPRQLQRQTEPHRAPKFCSSDGLLAQ